MRLGTNKALSMKTSCWIDSYLVNSLIDMKGVGIRSFSNSLNDHLENLRLWLNVGQKPFENRTNKIFDLYYLNDDEEAVLRSLAKQIKSGKSDHGIAINHAAWVSLNQMALYGVPVRSDTYLSWPKSLCKIKKSGAVNEIGEIIKRVLDGE